MIEGNPESSLEKEIRAVSGGKKPYIKPAFRSQEVFERMALSCGKTGVEFRCMHVNRKNS